MRQWSFFLAKQKFKYAISEGHMVGPSVCPFLPKIGQSREFQRWCTWLCESVVSILSLWFVYYVSPLYCITYDTTDFKRMHIILFTIWILLRCMCIGTTHTHAQRDSFTHTHTHIDMLKHMSSPPSTTFRQRMLWCKSLYDLIPLKFNDWLIYIVRFVNSVHLAIHECLSSLLFRQISFDILDS